MSRRYNVSTNEKEFILTALTQGLRLDNRKLQELRNIEIDIDSREYGVVNVKLGKTEVSCRITSEITVPYEERPFEGIFQINTEISPMASPFFQSGATGASRQQSDDEVLITRVLEKAIRRSNALDLESLCIIAGAKVWSIKADLQFLNYDGNFIDCSCIALITSLLHYRKADIEISGENVVLYSQEQRNPVKLSVLHIPICLTFNFFNPNDEEENIKGDLNNEIILVDCNLKEESLSLGSMTITMNKNKEICQIVKSGGLAIDAKMIMNCTNITSKLCDDITDFIKDKIKKDDLKRIGKSDFELQATNDR